MEATAHVDGSRAETSEAELTQDTGRKLDGDDESYCTQVVPQQEPKAFLLWKDAESHLPLDQRNLRLQLPTEPNSEILINLGRLKPCDVNSSRYQQLVRISDPNRPPDKQIISREHSQILIRKSESGEFSVKIQDTKDHERRRTVLVSQTGVSRVINYYDFQPLMHGDLIHLTPRAPPIQGDPSVLYDYHCFRFELDFPAIIPRADALVQSDRDRESPDISFKFLLSSPMVGKLMGTGGSTIRQIRDANNCELCVSPWGSFHPRAVASHGRTVQCFAKTQGALIHSLMAVLETIFAEDRKSAHLQLVLPTELTSSISPARLSEIQESSGVTLFSRPPNPLFTEEQFLECRGSLEAFTNLLPLLCALFCFPLPYQYGTEYEPLSTVPIDSTSSQRWKRKRYVERASHRVEKRSKQHTWGPKRGGPGRRGGGPGTGTRGAAHY